MGWGRWLVVGALLCGCGDDPSRGAQQAAGAAGAGPGGAAPGQGGSSFAGRGGTSPSGGDGGDGGGAGRPPNHPEIDLDGGSHGGAGAESGAGASATGGVPTVGPGGNGGSGPAAPLLELDTTPHLTSCPAGPADTQAAEQGICQQGWCWEYPLPVGYAIEAVHAFGPNDVWAANGDAGLIHFDGSSWSVAREAATQTTWGVDLWGSDSGELWVASSSEIWRWDGSTVVRVSDTGAKAIDGGGNEIWRLVSSGVERWTGTDWAPLADQPEADYTSLYDDLTVIGPGEGWVVGSKYLGHYVNGSWKDRLPAELQYAEVVWASGSDNVWIAGLGPFDFDSKRPVRLYRYNGSSMRSFDPGGVGYKQSISAISGTGPDNVWFGTQDGRLLHYDGNTLAEVTPPGAAVEGLSVHGDRVWAALGTEFPRSYSDGAWLDEGKPQGELVDVWGTSLDDVWAVGGRGRMLHFEGEQWTVVQSPTTSDIVAIWASQLGDMWAGTRAGEILFNDGSGWVTWHHTPFEITDVWGATTADVYFSTREGLLLRMHYGELEIIDVPLVEIRSLWVGGADNIWLMGTHTYPDTFSHFDGEIWRHWRTPTLVVPKFGALIYATRAVFARSAADIWFGDAQDTYRFDGNFLDIGANQEGETLHIGGCGPDWTWIAGGDAVWIHNGLGFEPHTKPGPILNAAWGTHDNLVVVGPHGILRRTTL